MSSLPRQPALLPLYTTRFECARERCPDTCCSGWKVTVDRAAYERFNALPPSPVRNKMVAALERCEPATDRDFAWIRPARGSLSCPLLVGGLCSAHTALGPDVLANGCASYPRFTRSLADELSMGMSLSCPEAARLALLAPDAFEFLEGELAVREGSIQAVGLPFGMSPEAAQEVRAFCLDLVRAREVAPWARLALLGLFCEQLTARVTTGRGADVPGLLASFRGELTRPGVRVALDEVASNPAAQFELCTALLRSGSGAPPSPVQERVLEAVSAGLGGESASEQTLARYEQGLTRLPEALAAAPYLLENYLLNEVFREAFPFDRETPTAHFVDLAARFCVLRLFLAARCVEGPLPTPAELVETVHVFCRRFQHDPAFVNDARAAFHARGWHEMGPLLPVLRA
jgi:lysine-N-methylase